MKPVNEVMQEMREQLAAASSIPMSPQLSVGSIEPEPCEACGGFGYVVHDVSVTDPTFGKTYPCRVCGVVAARKVEAMFGVRGGFPAFYAGWTLDSMPVCAENHDALDALRKWTESISPRWLYVHGPAGVGKTGGVVSAAKERVQRFGTMCRFMTLIDLLDAIKGTFGSRDGVTAEDVIDAACAVELLVLDDIGAEKPTDWVQEKFLQIVDRRKNARLCLVVTSNYNPKDLGERMGDTLGRITSRLTANETTDVIKMGGQNLRWMEAKQ